ncbi:alpha/beta hydrolase [Leucobacter weissii]|uniref:Alpha/beta hydrolase n=1 Tax=Leucobacter weissii TaxID=1983706 RepID=A0A939MJL3_9MICO|nr:alpha/beta fold hydrolase [Leucobacter weissii]MBO1901185.1 alpha/beta hydrolase [Leucobacter weissii]
MGRITSGTVLRARREDIELRTEDGLTLVGELALPERTEPRATLVTLHPLPTHGGYMDSHVLRKASWRLPELAGLAVLRFNTRGTTSPRGTSEGSFGEGEDERLDVAAAMRFVAERGLPDPWLVGWSFGTELALKHGLAHPISGAILLSPPLRRTSEEELAAWAETGVPLVALVPELDDFLRPEEAIRRFSAVPHARVVPVDGAKHLWVGESYVRRVLDEIVRTVGTAPTPLPEEATEDQLSG